MAPQENLNRRNQKILGARHEVGEGIFVLSKEEYSRLGELNDLEKKLIRPYYTSKEINRYVGDRQNNYYIIYTDKTINKNISKYPNIKAHLDIYEEIMTSDNKPYGLHRPRRTEIFIGEKIIGLRKCIEPSFSYVDFDTYISQTFNIIKTDRIDLKYLTGILNSNVVKFWLRFKGKMQGDHYQVDKGPLLSIPIVRARADRENKIIDLVEKRINNENSEEIQHLEKKINRLTYELYKLDDEDIAIIEKNI